MNHPELVHGLELLPCAIRDGMLYIPHADGNWVSAAKLQPFSLAIIDCWRAEQTSAALPTTLKAAPEAVPVDEVMDAEAYAELFRLREAVKGPAGFATWQDAAVDERIRRVKAEAALTAKHDTAPQALKAGDAQLDLTRLVRYMPTGRNMMTTNDDGPWVRFEAVRDLLTAPCAGDAPETVSEDARMLTDEQLIRAFGMANLSLEVDEMQKIHAALAAASEGGTHG